MADAWAPHAPEFHNRRSGSLDLSLQEARLAFASLFELPEGFDLVQAQTNGLDPTAPEVVARAEGLWPLFDQYMTYRLGYTDAQGQPHRPHAALDYDPEEPLFDDRFRMDSKGTEGILFAYTHCLIHADESIRQTLYLPPAEGSHEGASLDQERMKIATTLALAFMYLARQKRQQTGAILKGDSYRGRHDKAA